ncbi:hypothetical protein [Desulfurobacterium crinifex]
MLIAKPCHTSEEIADFVNTYSELVDGYGVVREVIPPVVILFVQEGKEEEAKRIRDELEQLQKVKGEENK